MKFTSPNMLDYGIPPLPNWLDFNTFPFPLGEPDHNYAGFYLYGVDDELESLANDYLYDDYQLASTESKNRTTSADEFDTLLGEIVELDRKDEIIVGTGRGNEEGPLVRVVDPVTGADIFRPFFAFEPSFQGGVRVYGADVTGDGEPDIITAAGPGRPGEVKVWELIDDRAVENRAYNFFPFGRDYTGGVEISVGSITAAGKTEIVAAQNLGGLVSIFGVSPTSAYPNRIGSPFSGITDWQTGLVRPTPIRQLRPFGTSYLGAVRVETADVGTISGSNDSSVNPDGIMELFLGSGFGIQAQVRGYNCTTSGPTRFNSFDVIGDGYRRGVSVARLPSRTTNAADRILVSSGLDGNSLVEIYNGRNSTRDNSFFAYIGSRAEVFSAAIDDGLIFNAQGLLGNQGGVQDALLPSGESQFTFTRPLPQSLVISPPLQIAILRNKG